jgi:DNA segregation ATPase FtsK/SpoIIIE-like protein
MDRRYALFEKSGADDLATYEPKLPRILVVCDEYADLVAGGGKTQKAIEAAISRLGAKARAAGIHLILATQQPSRQIMRGAIQTNIPCRVGLKTQKAIESQMLLNQPGAEALLGHGDLLFKDIGDPVRLQSPLTTRDERRAIFHPNGLGRASSPSQR